MKGKTCEWSCKSKGGQKTQEISQPWNCAGKKNNSAKNYFLEVLVDAVLDKGRAGEQQVNMS